jgi:hypothetical protein
MFFLWRLIKDAKELIDPQFSGYCAISFWTFLILSASLQAGRGELGRLRRSAVLVYSCFFAFGGFHSEAW